MIGIIIGTTAALGACIYLNRRRRCGGRWQGGHCGHHGHGRRHGWGRADFGSRGPGRWAAMMADRLDASREQEQVMSDALRGLLGELRTLGDEAVGTRGDLGAAFGAERLDEQRLGELFARHDELLGSARKAVVGALAKIHDVLDPKQREQLSRWIGRRGFGPYRM
jgi:Spy/CpxP family protein refolding chaperone